jgi:hypothetical protein
MTEILHKEKKIQIKITSWKELSDLYHQKLWNNTQLIRPHEDQTSDAGHRSTQTKNKDSLKGLNWGHGNEEPLWLSSLLRQYKSVSFRFNSKCWHVIKICTKYFFIITNQLKIAATMWVSKYRTCKSMIHKKDFDSGTMGRINCIYVYLIPSSATICMVYGPWLFPKVRMFI